MQIVLFRRIYKLHENEAVSFDRDAAFFLILDNIG